MDDLSNKIWLTQKSRIAAEKRLSRYDFFSQVILVWYSCALLAGSIYSLRSPSDDASATLVVLSAMALVASIFVSGRRFCQRGMLLRQCYEELGRLYGETKISSRGEKEIWDDYFRVLSISENHNDSDFCAAMVGLKWSGAELNQPVTQWMHIKFIFSNLVMWIFFAGALSAPVFIGRSLYAAS